MIDWERVAELRSEIGQDDFGEVVECFLEEVDEVVERLETTPDPATYGADLHFLKGSALNLGFRKFSLQCQRGEHLANAGKEDEIDLAEVIEAYKTSKTVFIQKMEENQGVPNAV